MEIFSTLIHCPLWCYIWSIVVGHHQVQVMACHLFSNKPLKWPSTVLSLPYHKYHTAQWSEYMAMIFFTKLRHHIYYFLMILRQGYHNFTILMPLNPMVTGFNIITWYCMNNHHDKLGNRPKFEVTKTPLILPIQARYEVSFVNLNSEFLNNISCEG